MEGFGKCVGNHIICRAVDEFNRSIFNDIANEMELNVNVLGMNVVLIVFGKCKSRLVIRKESCEVKLSGEKLQEEGMNPKAFLCSMSNGKYSLSMVGRETIF